MEINLDDFQGINKTASVDRKVLCQCGITGQPARPDRSTHGHCDLVVPPFPNQITKLSMHLHTLRARKQRPLAPMYVYVRVYVSPIVNECRKLHVGARRPLCAGEVRKEHKRTSGATWGSGSAWSTAREGLSRFSRIPLIQPAQTYSMRINKIDTSMLQCYRCCSFHHFLYYTCRPTGHKIESREVRREIMLKWIHGILLKEILHSSCCYAT